MLANLSIAKLVVAYNSLAAALDLKPVKKFTDRATAEKRVGDLIAKLQAAGKVVTLAEAGEATISEPKPEPKPEPAAKPSATAKPAKAPAGKSGRPPAVADGDVIVVLTEGRKNPKKGQAANRFAKYAEGITVAEYIKAIAKLSNDAEPRRQGLRDLAWDTRQGWVEVISAKAYAKRKAKADAAASEPAPEAKAA